jgi:hypothetical protein
MKYLFLLLPFFGYGQRDTLMCKERGHVNEGWYMSTALYCPSYVLDTDTTTIEVHPSCNTITFECKRCGKFVSEPEKERKVVIWRKPK